MKKILIFGLTGGGILIILNLLSIKASEYFKDESLFVNGTKRELVKTGQYDYKEGKTNILFLGTSEVYAAIDPLLFDSLNNYITHSINMGLMGMPSDPALFILKDYLVNNPPPEMIFIELVSCYDGPFRAFGKYSIQGMRFPDELMSYIFHLKNKDFLINLLLPIKIYHKNVIQYLYCTVFQREKIEVEKQTRERLKISLINQNGFIPYGHADEFIDDKELQKKYKNKASINIGEPSENKNIEKFFEMTEELDIKVFIIITPKNNIKYNNKIPVNYFNEVEYFLDKFDNIIHQQCTNELLQYPNRFFVNEDHLNILGTQKYTRFLINEIYQNNSSSMN